MNYSTLELRSLSSQRRAPLPWARWVSSVLAPRPASLTSLVRRRARALARAILLLLALGGTVRADENIMGYVYGAETLPKGKWEAYTWLTSRIGKESGTYYALDQKTEIEYGITDRFQASLYLNTSYHNLKNAKGSTETFDDLQGFGLKGFQTAFKYNVLSPYKDPIGFSLYFEPGYSRIDDVSGERNTEYELETKLIFQKNFLDDTLIAQVNLTFEPEWEQEEGHSEFETELKLEYSGGISYRFAPNWFAGVESRVHTELPEYEKFEHAAVFIGPSVHYGSEKWWATLTVLPQVYGWTNGVDTNGRHLDEHEKVEVRVKIGYNF